jgi:protein O-GlcNAc transferase
MTQSTDELLKIGISHHQSGRLVEAQQLYLQVLKQQPNCIDALHNLGVIACQSQQFAIGIGYFKQALALTPQRIDTYNNLSHALRAIANPSEAIEHYEEIIALCPNRADIHCTVAQLLMQQERWAEAIAHYQQAIEIQPESSQVYLDLSNVLMAQQQLETARQYLQKLIKLQPDCAGAYWQLCSIFRQTCEFVLWRQMAERYSRFCNYNDAIRVAIALIQVYGETGLHSVALKKLEELELQVYRDTNSLSEQDIKHLYFIILPALSNLRDDLAANSRFAKLIGALFAKQTDRTLALIPSKINQAAQNQGDRDAVNSDLQHNCLRIGIVSANFRRHLVGWCSVDVIQALAKLTPYVYLYATSEFQEDDRTEIFAKIATKSNWLGENWQQQKKSAPFNQLSQLIAEIEEDNLDVLIDLDSLTTSGYPEILRRQPAHLCVSWLGSNPPYISSENYNLSDHHTHPPGIDNYYLETMIKLPDVRIAMSGFPSLAIDVKAKRKSLKIRSKDIVYLCVAPSSKLNPETITAHIQILKSVPNSVLLYQGMGDMETICSHYDRTCEAQGIDCKRVIFLLFPETEEERRSIYAVADILLDSYPHNGISQILEALWFDLPVVTRLGEQSSARIGYSFLTTLGITAGVAHSWDEYVEWGASLGQFPALRNSIKEQLIQSKRPESLAPLWNPSKLAEDMYKLLAEILAGQRESNPVMYFELGNRSWLEGNIDEATRRYRQAIALQPSYAEAWGNLGTALHGQNQLDEAIEHYQKSLQLNPINFVIQSNLGRALKSQGNYDAAIKCYKKAIDIDPSNVNPYNRLGDMYFERREYAVALRYYQQALAIDPGHAFSHSHSGVIYLELNQVNLAIHSFQQALATDPTYNHAHFNLSLALLLKGELRTGFIEYEWRWQCQDIPNLVPAFSQPLSQSLSQPISQPLWNGGSFSGRTLLISAEQGFGDIIQFIRYIPLVKAIGGENARILFDCPTPLISLFEGIKDLTLVTSSSFLPKSYLRVSLLSLPRILGTTIDNIPAAVPYLFVPTDRSQDSSNELSQSTTHQMRIGVVWAVNGNSSNALKCSCPLPLFRRLLDRRQAIFYSLQEEIAAEDEQLFDTLTWQIVDLRDRISDFADTAALIAQMDLVITVDTAVAHLAGALGKPVWVMLPFAADWRWMLGREDSPWYPTMRLFRQWHIGDWEGVIERVINALRDWVD